MEGQSPDDDFSIFDVSMATFSHFWSWPKPYWQAKKTHTHTHIVNFVWIIRFPADRKATSLEDALPPRFLDRVKGRGMVVTGWAPQAEILAHPSTGGLVTHCVWNSIMESMYFGLPVIAMPMKLDQPINVRMLSEAGSCVEVSRNDGKEVFKGEEIAKAIKKVVAEESGDALRIRARELSEMMKMEKEEALDEAKQQSNYGSFM